MSSSECGGRFGDDRSGGGAGVNLGVGGARRGSWDGGSAYKQHGNLIH